MHQIKQKYPRYSEIWIKGAKEFQRIVTNGEIKGDDTGLVKSVLP